MNADQKIAEVERILDYVFVNKLLCAEAIQMAAPMSPLSINGRIHSVDANKRLAILGDAVATSILCKAWFRGRDQNGRFAHGQSIPSFLHANPPEGNPQSPTAWTNIRQRTLQNAALARLGNAIGLGTTIVASAGHFGPPGTIMMATAFEALLGAVYEDAGEHAVTRVMAHVGLTHPASVMSKHPNPLQHPSGPPLLTDMLLLDAGCGVPLEPP
ncbi:hypothetical protein P171DRAFT_197645 [Karstenula rhodostoma CBS 690.94]|uniref:RNase III domain-containing protein n=1 Tax=Karstenula rhodostoma CBS 690.94 TaxID=1392251 RepID=A0A9P4UHW3_9PLEO|nr:hypothetical protein P171DRAFT_197645 [Karstenula rhodostoma CBS 690.94]